MYNSSGSDSEDEERERRKQEQLRKLRLELQLSFNSTILLYGSLFCLCRAERRRGRDWSYWKRKWPILLDNGMLTLC